jgi:hypothetical protein
MRRKIPKKAIKTRRKDLTPHRRTYTSFQVIEILGIKREKLQDWLARGFVEPDVKAKGYGTKNLFTKANLYQIKLFITLTEYGFLREEAARRVKEMQKIWPVVEKEGAVPHFFRLTRKRDKYFAQLLGAHGAEGVIESHVDLDADEVQFLNIKRIIDEVDMKISG